MTSDQRKMIAVGIIAVFAVTALVSLLMQIVSAARGYRVPFAAWLVGPALTAALAVLGSLAVYLDKPHNYSQENAAMFMGLAAGVMVIVLLAGSWNTALGTLLRQEESDTWSRRGLALWAALVAWLLYDGGVPAPRDLFVWVAFLFPPLVLLGREGSDDDFRRVQRHIGFGIAGAILIGLAGMWLLSYTQLEMAFHRPRTSADEYDVAITELARLRKSLAIGVGVAAGVVAVGLWGGLGALRRDLRLELGGLAAVLAFLTFPTVAVAIVWEELGARGPLSPYLLALVHSEQVPAARGAEGANRYADREGACLLIWAKGAWAEAPSHPRIKFCSVQASGHRRADTVLALADDFPARRIADRSWPHPVMRLGILTRGPGFHLGSQAQVQEILSTRSASYRNSDPPYASAGAQPAAGAPFDLVIEETPSGYRYGPAGGSPTDVAGKSAADRAPSGDLLADRVDPTPENDRLFIVPGDTWTISDVLDICAATRTNDECGIAAEPGWNTLPP